MANPIQYVELFEEQLQTKIKALNDEMKELNATMESIVAKAGNVSKAIKATTPTTKDSQTAISQLAKSVEGLKFQYDSLDSKLKQDAQDVAILAQKKRELTYLAKQEAIANESLKGSYNQINAEYKKYVSELNRATPEMKVMGKSFEEAQKHAKSLYEQLKQLDAATGKSQRNVGNYKSALDGVGLSTKDLGNTLKGVAARFVGWAAVIQTTIKGLKDAFNTIVEFEKSVSSLTAVVGKSGNAVEELSAQAILLSRNTQKTANEVVQLQLAMAKLGLTTNEIKAATQAVANFALATGADTADAAQLAVNAMNIFGASAQEVDRYVSAMTVSTYRSALNFGYLQTALATVAPVANTFGFSIEDTLALLGTLADRGFTASLAATATRNILLKLADANGELARALGRPVTNLDELIEGLKELDAQGINLAQTLEITDKRSVAAFNSFLRGADSIAVLRGAITDVNDEFKEATDIMTNNVAGSMKNIEASWDSIVLAFQNSKGIIKGVLDAINGALQEVSKNLATLFGQYYKQKVTEEQGKAQAEFYKAGGEAEGFKKKYKEYYDAAIKEGKTTQQAYSDAQAKIQKDLRTQIERESAKYRKEYKELQAKADKEVATELAQVSTRSVLGASPTTTASSLWGNQQSALAAAETRWKQRLDDFKAEYKGRIAVLKDYQAELRKVGETSTTTGTYTLPTDPKEAARQARREQAERERRARAYITELKRNFKAEKDAEEDAIKAKYDGQEKEEELAKHKTKWEKKQIDLDLEINKISIENLKDYKGYTLEIIQEMMDSKISITEKGEKELEKIRQKYSVQEQSNIIKDLQSKLKATRKGSDTEYKLQAKLLDAQMKHELEQSRMDRLEGKWARDPKDILDDYNRQRINLDNNWKINHTKLLQQLADSEFELEEHSENEIYKLKIRHQIELLELQRKATAADPQAAQEEIDLIDNQIKKLQKDLKKGDIRSIWDALGLDLSADDQKNLEQSIGYVVDTITQLADAQVEAAERVVEARQKEVDAAQSALDAELEARANGYANNVTLARKELEEKKKLQRKALDDQRKAQKQQAAIQTLEQIGNLVTATSLLWKQSGIFAPIAIATMWASFAASKIIAANMATKADNEEQYGNGTIEYLRGGSHQSGNDIDLGTKPDGTRRKAEGGETFAIINKRNTRKYGGLIPSVINALNEGTFLQKYGNNLDGDGTIALSVIGGGTTDLSNLERNVEQIAEQGARKEYVDSNGNTIVTYKNLKTIIKS